MYIVLGFIIFLIIAVLLLCAAEGKGTAVSSYISGKSVKGAVRGMHDGYDTNKTVLQIKRRVNRKGSKF